jgi:formyltetrahydrofolate deformylase
MDTALSQTATLLVTCRDRTGLVAALSNFVFQHGGNIVDADQHSECESDEFFMRLVWDLTGFQLDRQTTRREIEALARQFDLRWELTFSDVRPR